MAFEEQLAQRLRKFLVAHEGVSERKMMGALCFMLNGNMCCGVTGSELMVRVGRDAYPQVLSEPHVRAMEIGGRATAGFVLVDPDGFRSKASFEKWVRRGIAFASALPPK